MKILINGVEGSRIDVRDRGFQYGDGLFETIAYKNNELQLWDAHMQRLCHGCERLSLGQVDEALWLADIKRLALQENTVIKLSLSRGVTGRGYAFGSSQAPSALSSEPSSTLRAESVTRVTAAYAWPHYTAQQIQDRHQGISAIICKTPISINPLLAGIKHLNRLDNVLARNEWHSSDIGEGFMLDNHQHVIEGTMSNVFCVLRGVLYTPSLQSCGVLGVMRQRVIERARAMGIAVNVLDISKLDFLQMDSVFITNSLIGLCPVQKIIEDDVVTNFTVDTLVYNLQSGLV
ncbi:Aminodeoxychorismate lyase [hydrothermal vent metagenome]|uniref:aminodeoxychorismate lyase n=1 Tax=hydrothermal vent metagenome TaxID=652676 RepID=A0A3B0XKK8_9ZZZZ